MLRRERACGGFVEHWLEGGEVHWREVDAAAADGSGLVSELQGSVASEFGGPSRKRYGLFAVKELAVISDGAGRIRNVCEELFSGRAVTCIQDFFHLSERLSDALTATLPEGSERRRRFEADKAKLKDNQTSAIIADLRPYADRHADVAKCVKYMEANIGLADSQT